MTEHAVVVAGGGPAGLMLAAEVALARADVLVVERRASQDLDNYMLGLWQSHLERISPPRGGPVARGRGPVGRQ